MRLEIQSAATDQSTPRQEPQKCASFLSVFASPPLRTHGVKGTLAFGSSGSTNRKLCSYILQEDYLQPLFTVHEIMLMACDLKVSSDSLNRSEKLRLVSFQSFSFCVCWVPPESSYPIEYVCLFVCILMQFSLSAFLSSILSPLGGQNSRHVTLELLQADALWQFVRRPAEASINRTGAYR